jgi:hypothetical protein
MRDEQDSQPFGGQDQKTIIFGNIFTIPVLLLLASRILIFQEVSSVSL